MANKDFHRNHKVGLLLKRYERQFPETLDLIKDFSDDLIVEGISETRISTYIERLIYINKINGKRLPDFDLKDVKKVISHFQQQVNEGEYSQNSLIEVKKALRKFFKWYGKPELVNWFTLGEAKCKLSPSDLLTEDEFNQLIKACYNSRDRAMISLFYECGPRPGELASMRVRDVEFDQFGARVFFPESKTFSRPFRIIYSVSYLAAWLKDYGGEGDQPLFPVLIERRKGQPLKYDDINKQLKKIAKRAGLTKRIYPYIFRHTAATRYLKLYSEAIAEKLMGWSPGSKNKKKYNHLIHQDAEDAVLQRYGFNPQQEDELEIISCPVCKQINPATDSFCSQCGLPISPEALQEVEERSKNIQDSINQLAGELKEGGSITPELVRKVSELSEMLQK